MRIGFSSLVIRLLAVFAEHDRVEVQDFDNVRFGRIRGIDRLAVRSGEWQIIKVDADLNHQDQD